MKQHFRTKERNIEIIETLEKETIRCYSPKKRKIGTRWRTEISPISKSGMDLDLINKTETHTKLEQYKGISKLGIVYNGAKMYKR